MAYLSTAQFERAYQREVEKEQDIQVMDDSHLQLLTEIDQLKEDHCQTVLMMERLYKNQRELNNTTMTLLGRPCMTTCQSPNNTCTTTCIPRPAPNACTCTCISRPAPNACTCTCISPNTCTCQSPDQESDRVTCSSPPHYDTSIDSRESSDICSFNGYYSDDNVINTMWNGFSVSDYTLVRGLAQANVDMTPERTSGPKITIPMPFSMTLREEKKEKKKSRSLEIAERERLEHEAQEQAHLARQFKANPVPATTFLPLYEMINACNEQRREEVRQNCKKLLKNSERPFSFTVREDLKKREERKDVNWEIEEHNFQAKPVPQYVFDSTVDERMKEEEEYRKIRIKLRALETLANSQLPSTMQDKGRQYTIGKLRKAKREEREEQAFLTPHHSFRPAINEQVPDHRFAYEEFEQQLNERKKLGRATTIVEPFDLRIDRRLRLRKHKALEADLNKTSTSYKNNIKLVPKSILRSSRSSQCHMIHSNEQVTRERVEHHREEEEEEEEVEEEEEITLQRDREHGLMKEKSVRNDLSLWLETRRRETLKRLKQFDIENRLKYELVMEEITKRDN